MKLHNPVTGEQIQSWPGGIASTSGVLPTWVPLRLATRLAPYLGDSGFPGSDSQPSS